MSSRKKSEAQKQSPKAWANFSADKSSKAAVSFGAVQHKPSEDLSPLTGGPQPVIQQVSLPAASSQPVPFSEIISQGKPLQRTEDVIQRYPPVPQKDGSFYLSETKKYYETKEEAEDAYIEWGKEDLIDIDSESEEKPKDRILKIKKKKKSKKRKFIEIISEEDDESDKEKEEVVDEKQKKKELLRSKKSKDVAEKNKAAREIGKLVNGLLKKEESEISVIVQGGPFAKMLAKKDGKKIEEAPKSFDGKREKQLRRWVSTILFNYYNLVKETTTQEVQAGMLDGKLGLAANEDSIIKSIRETIKSIEDLRVMAKEMLEFSGKLSETKLANPKIVSLQRTMRHSLKFLRDKYGVLDDIKEIEVVPTKKEDGVHAELRLVDIGYINIDGVKRPCISCAVMLTNKDILVESVGPYWFSESAGIEIYKMLKIPVGPVNELTEDQQKLLAETIYPFMEKSKLTKVKGGAGTDKYGEDSDSEVDENFSDESDFEYGKMITVMKDMPKEQKKIPRVKKDKKKTFKKRKKMAPGKKKKEHDFESKSLQDKIKYKGKVLNDDLLSSEDEKDDGI